MKKILLLAVMAAFVSCGSINRDAKSEEEITEMRSVEGFHEIILRGSPSVYYQQDRKYSVKVVAPKGLAGTVRTVVEGKSLVIGMDSSNGLSVFNLSTGTVGDVEVYVTSPDITAATLLGSGDFHAKKRVDTDNMRVELRGSGSMLFDDLICDRLSAELVGSGEMCLRNVDALEAGVSLVGSGDMDISLLNAKTVSVVLEGSGDIKATLNKCGAVKSDLRGSGDISLGGTVGTLDKTRRGSGDYDTDGLRVTGGPM